jgi:polysaccharide deacetylase family protein (PEP-CTERM system associated)
MASVPAPALSWLWDQEKAIAKGPTQLILSFDVEEHYRIEAASGLTISPALEEHYRARLEPSLQFLLEALQHHDLKATFFIVGQIAQHSPGLVRAIHQAGHEVASHSWDHRRVHHFTPATFREDVRKSRDALEQATGGAVLGYRAPTFSIVRETSWALGVLAELGMVYDSSIYPIRHDRYGVPRAPRVPFRARGTGEPILELPPATLRVLGSNVPVGGGGYFRLLPLTLLERGLHQVGHDCHPSVAMLYFHPWEFDVEQARLPLGVLRRFRTYVGLGRNRARFKRFLSRHPRSCFARAIDVARDLSRQRLPIVEI